MSDSVDRVFVHALNTVKRIPRTGTARPPASERLKLYGLYKQSMEGDVEGVMDRPVGNTADVFMECEKWDAWSTQRGLSRTEAKRRYISTLISTMHSYASQTAEARELVAELEFVWDQIKSNTGLSSSSSSRDQGSSGSARERDVPPVEYQSRMSRPEYEQLLSTGRGDSRLRVMSPVKRGDVEEEEEEEDEVYAEAQDNLFEDDDEDEDDNEDDNIDDHNHHHHHHAHDHDYYQQQSYPLPSPSPDQAGIYSEHTADRPARIPPRDRDRDKDKDKDKDRRWRRRVEQALTKMTAEIAALREQLETRALAHRRRSGLWAWLKWLTWTTTRQLLVDLAVFGLLLLWMRLRGDRRLEQKVRVGWAEVKSRLARWRVLRRRGS
ncbi:hypothetical protein BO70DRAFT_363343 [Aspergillus heteromorphus CBS 117.55]|uniref:ACB domain-containing protein n=1 Tax=Aspergillus heteromorphus CBS 117.55 TaxID=1448321 RepID=A0A317VSV7_9EURO|nr:uncharacterized protein BO70DRAFT_363343 [Aspergillus heteromorphus CBS 117.55]PWY77416.1 hypothetical protein BO70DRAFT_363343 [Aspergillus heteromorphus CBS 117.55]